MAPPGDCAGTAVGSRQPRSNANSDDTQCRCARRALLTRVVMGKTPAGYAGYWGVTGQLRLVTGGHNKKRRATPHVMFVRRSRTQVRSGEPDCFPTFSPQNRTG